MSIWQDLRYSVRKLRSSPGFATAAILTLALGIGANTAIFSVINGVLLGPLPFRDPGKLVAVWELSSGLTGYNSVLPANAMHFLEWRKQLHSFDSLALLDGVTMNLTGAGEPRRVTGERVSATLFPMLRLQPQLGRTFREDEDHPGQDREVVLSGSLWKQQFHASPNILGRTVTLDGASYKVIGVMPAGMPRTAVGGIEWSKEKPQFWIPFAIRDSQLDSYGDFNYDCIGRLRAGVSLSQAQAELNAIQAQIASTIPEKVELRAKLVTLREQVTGEARKGLLLLFAAVGMVLLIGCVNVANLLLARGAGRGREFAIRVAVGASRGHLLKQSLTESFVLSAIGGTLGVCLAYATFGFLIAHAPADLPRLDEVSINAPVLLFALLVTAVTGVLSGLLPAMRHTRVYPQDALKSGTHTVAEGGHGARLRSTLVSVEVALSTVCLIAVGLLLHSFVQLMRVDKGFSVQRVLTVGLNLPDRQYPELKQRAEFWRRLLPRVQNLPGVLAVGISNRLPLAGEGSNNWIIPEGQKIPLAERPIADMRFVNAGFFKTLGISLEHGRIFTEADKQKVVVVSAKTAARLFPGQNPLNRRFHLGDETTPLLEIVGVVGDVRGNGLQKAPAWTVYLPFWERDRQEMSLAVRTATDPLGVATAVRQAISSVDPDMPIPQFSTMNQLMDDSVAHRRFQVMMVALFGGVALLLASLGVYGVVSYTVAQRTGELGIRLALGANPEEIGRLVLRQGMTPVLQGLGAGLVLALVLGRIIGSLLFGVSAHDPLTIGVVIVLLAGVAAFACWIPARRTMRIDPIQALRYE